MKKLNLRFDTHFRTELETPSAQAATMTLEPGQSSGGLSVHKADQWLFVVSGTAEARVEGKCYALSRHSLIVIEAGETHEIFNTGEVPLETLNMYTPPEF